MLTGGEFLAQQASEDVSFSGPFAYYSNTPMKVFAGSLESPPTAVLIEALNRIQSGGAQPEAVKEMGQALEMQSDKCYKACVTGFQECLGGGGSLLLDQVPEDHQLACQAAHDTCRDICAS